MTKLKIAAVLEQRPVKVTIDLPAEIDRDLRAYAELMKRESGCSIEDPVRLIVPMSRRFMATDRIFRKFQRRLDQEKKASVAQEQEENRQPGAGPIIPSATRR